MQVKTLPVGPIGTNCYLLCDEDAKLCAIVDPGEDAPAIRQMIEQSGCTPKMILATHGHYDHITAVKGLLHYYPDLPVYIHPEDYAGAGTPAFYQLPATLGVVLCGEGDRLHLGGLAIDVLHTPGHTPGSVTFRVNGVLFTGDTLFRGSMGRTDFEGGSYETIMKSLNKLGKLVGDYRVCPGHEGASTLDTERQTNYYLREAMGG